MCGRFQFSWEDDDPAIERFNAVFREKYPGIDPPAGEIRPSAMFPVLIRGEEKAVPEIMRWGMDGFSGTKLVINARAETVFDRPLFAESAESRRCIVLTTGFYEWDREKQKYLFRLLGRRVTFLAGLYDRSQRFAILTRQANDFVSPVHDRMPVIVGTGEISRWLSDSEAARKILLRPGPPLEAQRITA